MEGSQTKMREVIKALLDVLHDMGVDEETVAISAESANCHMNSSEVLETIRNAKAVLAAPPRNCEVGTVEEQFRRYHKFCMDGHGCSRCRVGIFAGVGCSLAWAQLLYEKGGAK